MAGCALALSIPILTLTGRYVEHPDGEALAIERLGKLMDDPTSLASLAVPSFHAVGIGWTLHRQGYGYLETAYYREIEAPLDCCSILDAMIGDAGRTIAGMHLTRPRSARPFTVDDVRKIDRLRPWLAHAFRRKPPVPSTTKWEFWSGLGAPVLKGQMILTSDARIVFQTRV